MDKFLLKSYDYADDGMDLVKIFADEPHLFFLDSSLSDSPRGRYSFIGFDPFFVFSSRGADSLESLRKEFNQYAVAFENTPVPLCSGIVGFLSYDLGLKFENIKRQLVDDVRTPDCLFGFYDALLTVDHHQKKLYVTSTGFPEKNHNLIQRRAQERLQKITARISTHLKPGGGAGDFSADTPGEELGHSNFTQLEYLIAIDRALDHIRRGDIYQINLSQRFSVHPMDFDWDVEPLELYKALRRRSPSYFGGYFDAGNFQIVSSSPEQFLRKQGSVIETRPMKGTRPRGETPAQDAKRKNDLLASPKEIAELLMVTDLERNDLGRVCEYGSVRVKDLRRIEEYKTVFQATSAIEGKIRYDKDCFDVLKACFPSGSVTGCPKIRAMEIIEELEGRRRGIYTGSLGYISFNNEMDFNVLIRTMLVTKREISFHVGGGIVADSVPQKEYEETLVKAAAMRQALHSVLSVKVGVR